MLIAATVASHPHHSLAAPWLRRVESGELAGVLATHTLAETYAVLTTLPHAPRITAEAATEVVEFLGRQFRVVGLGGRDYSFVVRTLAAGHLTGGVVYDGLAVHAAKKAGAASIVTCNRRDFVRLGVLFGVRVEALLA